MKRAAVILFAVLCAPAFSSSVEVKVLVSAQETTVGVPVEFTVSVAAPDSNIAFDLPDAKKYSSADLGVKVDPKKITEEDAKLPLFVVDGVDVADLSTAGAFRKTVKVRVVYCVPGSYPVPPLAVRDTGRPVPFDSPRVTVKAVNESGETADIEPPLELGGNHTRIFVMLIAALLLGAAGLAFWRWWTTKRKKVISAEPERPAIEVFMEKAGSIGNALNENSMAPDEFALELSMTFRRLISSLYGFDAAEMTSRELLDSIISKRKGLTAERYGAQLEGIMALWDMTKFAEFNPSAEILRANLKDTMVLAEKMWRDLRGI